jgi:hypothetical protein
MVYVRDEHPPAHVHVEKAGSKIKIILGQNAVEVHSYKGDPSDREIACAAQIVADHLAQCWTTWKKYNL